MNNTDKKNIINAFVSFIMATLGMIAYIYSTRFSINYPIGVSDTIGFMPADLIILIVLTVLYYKILKSFKKVKVYLLLMSIFIAITSLVLTELYKYKEVFYLLRTVPLLYIICISGYAFMYYSAMSFLDSYINTNIAENTKIYTFKPLKLSLIIMLISLIIYIPMFPGAIRFEAGLTLKMISNEAPARYIAPPFWQIFVSVFYNLAKALNSDTLGLVLYFAVVGFACFYALSLVIVRAAKLGINKNILMFLIIFTAFNPFIILKTYTMKYDTLIAIAMLYLSILLYDLIIEAKDFIKPKKLIALGVAAFGVCAFRNVGVYIAIISGVFIAVYALRHFARKGLLVLLSLVLGVGVYISSAYFINKAQNLPNYNSLGSDSVMIQQMGYTLRNHGTDALTESEKVELSEFMLPTAFEMHYKQNIVDNILHNIEGEWTHRELSSEQRQSLRKVWASLGRRYPVDYVKAFFLNNNRYYMPGYYDDVDLFGSYYQQSFYMDSLPKSFEPHIHSEYWQNSLEWFKYIAGYVSVYGVYMGSGFIGLGLIIMSLTVLRNKSSLLPILPAILYYIGALFSPVNGWVRYITPVGFVFPAAMLYTLYSYKKRIDYEK